MPKNKKARAVLDTNLIISAALIPQSLPDRLFHLWLEDSFDLLISKEQLEEIKAVSRKSKLVSYPLFSDRITELTANLEFAAELVKPIPETSLSFHSRDPKDDYLLAASIGGRADYLVTGDEDLLILNDNLGLGKLKIVSAKQFLIVVNHNQFT